MFFMGGMTMGYLHPPAKDAEASRKETPEEKNRIQFAPAEAPVSSDGVMERSLLWARRILC